MIRKALEIMNNILETYSPLAEIEQIDSSNIKIEALDFIGKINLRIRNDDAESHKRVSDYLNYDLPISAGQVQGNNETRTAWLGPDEFLIQCVNDKKLNIISEISDILNNSFFSITDVSDYYLTIRLSGPNSIDVLSKGCPLNFKKYLCAKDTCAQSYITKATVFIDRLSNDQIFDIYVRWSFAEYLWDWLKDASLEFISSKS